MKKPILTVVLTITTMCLFAKFTVHQTTDSTTKSYVPIEAQKPLPAKPIAQNLSARTTHGNATTSITTNGVVNNYYNSYYTQSQPQHSEEQGGNYLKNPSHQKADQMMSQMRAFFFGALFTACFWLLSILLQRYQPRWPFTKKDK